MFYLGVKNDEKWEKKCPTHGKGSVNKLATDEDLEEAAQNENDEPGEEGCMHAREIPLGLECEGGEADHNGGGEEEGLHHHRLVEEGDQHTCGGALIFFFILKNKQEWWGIADNCVIPTV